jgi:hypothetical protein
MAIGLKVVKGKTLTDAPDKGRQVVKIDGWCRTPLNQQPKKYR